MESIVSGTILSQIQAVNSTAAYSPHIINYSIMKMQYGLLFIVSF